MSEKSKLVTISCPEHHETLVQRLWHFFQSGQRLDFDFSGDGEAIGGRPVLAHLLVVDAFMSPVNFGSDCKVQRDGSRDASASMDCLLEFMYRGTVSVAEKSLNDLLKIAEKFGFDMLVRAVKRVVCCKERRRSGRCRVPSKVRRLDNICAEIASDIESVSNCSSAKIRSDSDGTERGAPVHSAPDSLTATEAVTATVATGKNVDVVNSSSIVSRRGVGRPRTRCGPRRSDPKRVIQCEQCRYSTPNESAFRVHMAKHDTSIEVDRCDVCRRKLPSGPEALRSHECVDRYRFRCTHCSFRTYDKSRYQLHLATHDPDGALPVLRCPTCSKPFLRPEVLAKHEAKHHDNNSSAAAKSYSCSHCKYETPNRPTFMNHMYRSHGLDMYGVPLRKDQRCEQCDYRCVRPSELRRHFAVHHDVAKPFKCPLCPFAAAQRTYLYLHNQRKHVGKREHPCDTCQLRFHKKSDLERHSRTHTGERPFICEVCGKAYADPGTLRFHAECHREIAERHVCHICGHLAKRHQYLKAHLMNVHKINSAVAAATAKPKVKATCEETESMSGRGPPN